MLLSQLKAERIKSGHLAPVLCLDAWQGPTAGKATPFVVMSGAADGSLIFWDARKKKKLFVSKDHRDGKLLLSLRVFSMATYDALLRICVFHLLLSNDFLCVQLCSVCDCFQRAHMVCRAVVIVRHISGTYLHRANLHH
jgi:WD40 repeat protein